MICQFPDVSRGTRSFRQIHDAIAAFLHDSFACGDRPLTRIDRWSQQRVTVANQARLATLESAESPVRRCIADLTKDINKEAAAGVLLPTPAGNVAMLHRLSGDPGLTGRLFQHLDQIAPILFAEELERAGRDLSLLSAEIEARYDRASLDAEVSELILMYLLADDEVVADMADELRKTFYAYHEVRIRRDCGLPIAINDHSCARLASQVATLLAQEKAPGDRLRAG